MVKCARDRFVDCWFVKTQEQSDRCLLPNQDGAKYSCQAQGDRPQEVKAETGPGPVPVR